MSFLFPAFLLGALAVAIPIVLHLLRRDAAPEVPFTAVRLLKNSPIERSRRRRLRDLLLLVARAAALLLLARRSPGLTCRRAPSRHPFASWRSIDPSAWVHRVGSRVPSSSRARRSTRPEGTDE
jgi:hypothetical protein